MTALFDPLPPGGDCSSFPKSASAEGVVYRKASAFSGYVYIHTFGCQMNEYDSLRIRRLLEDRGYASTADMTEAHIIFLNTCSVRSKAEQKVHSFLGRLRRLKERRPEIKIVVGGCVAEHLGKAILARFDHVDLVLGTRGVGHLPRLLDELEASGSPLVCLPEEEAPVAASEPWTRQVCAPVTIMQGCDNFCTYCIVPYVRGRERSRPREEIVREIRWLARGGVREILLLGQNVNSYGRGLEERTTFSELLRRIAGECDVSRVRFTTSHPKDLDEELMRCFVEIPNLCKHLHLPLQAGGDAVLKRRGRGYTRREYLDRIRRLREICPEIGLSSDVMVGFPGETEEDHQATLEMLREVGFDGLFSFRYSDRPPAAASRYPDKTPEEAKARRLAELQRLQSEITLRKNEEQVGSASLLLVEGPSKASGGQLTGRTEQNRVVNFEGPRELRGRMALVEIARAYSHSLGGRFLHES